MIPERERFTVLDRILSPVVWFGVPIAFWGFCIWAASR